jgi:hypothetical protein
MRNLFYYQVDAIPEVIAHLRSISGVAYFITESGSPEVCGDWDFHPVLVEASKLFPDEVIRVVEYPDNGELHEHFSYFRNGVVKYVQPRRVEVLFDPRWFEHTAVTPGDTLAVEVHIPDNCDPMEICELLLRERYWLAEQCQQDLDAVRVSIKGQIAKFTCTA